MFLNWYKSYVSSCKMSTFDKYMYIYDSKCDVYTASQHGIWLSSMSKFINVRTLKKESLPWGQCLRLIFQNLSMLMNVKTHYTLYMICYYTLLKIKYFLILIMIEQVFSSLYNKIFFKKVQFIFMTYGKPMHI